MTLIRKSYFLLAIWALLPTSTVCALAQTVADTSSLFRADAERSQLDRALLSPAYANPALASFRLSSSLTSISASYDRSSSSEAMIPELGDACQFLGGDVSAYYTKGSTALWGGASYSNGVRENVAFNETSDFLLLRPYVMADTIGGDVRGERYSFDGGFTHRALVGIYGSYCAELDYRTSDPRPKNLTGDLRLSVAGGFSFASYVAALSVSARRYKQTNVVKFYSEVSTPVVYHMVGFNRDYYRFRGQNSSTIYDGYGFGLSADVVPQGRLGFFCSLAFERFSVEKVISSLNELPMSDLLLTDASALLGYADSIGDVRFAVSAEADVSKREGKENLFGDPASNMYPLIGSTDDAYDEDDRHFSLSAVAVRSLSSSLSLQLALHGGGSRYEQNYSFPSKLLSAKSRFGGVALVSDARLGRRFLLRLSVDVRHVWHGGVRYVVYNGEREVLHFPMRQQLLLLANGRTDLRFSLRPVVELKRGYAIFASASYVHHAYRASDVSDDFAFSIGFEF